MKRKYYHASPKRHKPGEVLVGQSCGWSSSVPVVFMTQSPIPHYTIFDEAVEDNWFIYRVIPTSKVKIGRCWDEALSESVEIVKCVGRAREFAKHSNKMGSKVFYKWIQQYWSHQQGSTKF